MKSKNLELSPFESHVLKDKGTEAPFSGEYENHFEKGIYCCKNCGHELYTSNAKFHSGCGWPSFDSMLADAVTITVDADGRRKEIICAQCEAHLGHVFVGENFTPKNTRHCVNSISIKFKADAKISLRSAYFASGCFWGTEYYFAQEAGVISSRVGFSGGYVENPTYKEVCAQKTGHLECVEILWDTDKTDYEKLARLFFETHDFSQENGQGPDLGPQYLSAVFVNNDEEKKTIEKLTDELKAKGLKVATTIRPFDKFYPAEEYHQKYYFRQAKTPYCHFKRKIF